MPERVVLIHIEYARDADDATGSGLSGNGFIVENAFIFVIEEVRNVGFSDISER